MDSGSICSPLIRNKANIPHPSAWTMAHNDKLVVSSQGTPHVALKERGGLEHHVLPLPMQSKMQISSGGRVRSHPSAVVASSPYGQRPPSSYNHSQVKQERDVSYRQHQLTVQGATQMQSCLFHPFTCLTLGLLKLRSIRKKVP